MLGYTKKKDWNRIVVDIVLSEFRNVYLSIELISGLRSS